MTFLSSNLTCPATQSRLSGRGRLLGLSCDSNHRSDLGLSELPVPGQQRSRNPHGTTFAMISANCVAGRDRGKGLPVLSARQFIGAATTALSLITGAFLLALAAGNAHKFTASDSGLALIPIVVMSTPG